MIMAGPVTVIEQSRQGDVFMVEAFIDTCERIFDAKFGQCYSAMLRFIFAALSMSIRLFFDAFCDAFESIPDAHFSQ